MACFVVPVAEAIVTSVATHILKSKEKKSKKTENISVNYDLHKSNKIPFSGKLKWLSNMLWGGSALLAFEHLWHGEIQPFFPFITGARTPESLHSMFYEMATVGIGMALTVTAVWTGMLIASNTIEKQKNCNNEKSETGETV
ncbi:MAG: hypothetical protein K2G63_01250 [Oscillospiraceae bacterium]|nr:hypothetical protein [Oscillospiraceae bacterium]